MLTKTTNVFFFFSLFSIPLIIHGFMHNTPNGRANVQYRYPTNKREKKLNKKHNLYSGYYYHLTGKQKRDNGYTLTWCGKLVRVDVGYRVR